MSQNPTTTNIESYIPRDANNVLEIGIGSINNVRLFKQFNPACHYTIIDTNQTSLDKASEWVDEAILLSDWTDTLPKSVTKKSLDCIIYDRILEKVNEPVALLSRHKSYLKPQRGVMVATIDNPQYWQTIIQLIKGQFAEEMKSLPLLTVSSLQQYFKEAGLIVDTIRGKGQITEDYEHFLGLIEPLTTSLKIHKEDFLKRTKAPQLISTVLPERLKNPSVHIQAIAFGNQGTVSNVRLFEPLEALNTLPSLHYTFDAGSSRINKVPDHVEQIFLCQRPLMSPLETGVNNIKAMLENNCLMIVEFDDHPDHWQEIIDTNYLAFRGCHAIQTSTPAMADYFKQYNPEVMIFPNQVDFLLPLPEENTPRLKIFCGAFNRSVEWEGIADKLNALCKAYPDAIEFDIVFDDTLYHKLETKHKFFSPLLPYKQYKDRIYKADIALMPLHDTTFNRMKSDLKFIEAASSGTISVASNIVYADSIEDGKTGMIFHDTDELYQKLEQLITQPVLRQSIRETAYKYIKKERMLYQHFRKRYDWYLDLLQRKDKLTKELLERTPELTLEKV